MTAVASIDWSFDAFHEDVICEGDHVYRSVGFFAAGRSSVGLRFGVCQIIIKILDTKNALVSFKDSNQITVIGIVLPDLGVSIGRGLPIRLIDKPLHIGTTVVMRLDLNAMNLCLVVNGQPFVSFPVDLLLPIYPAFWIYADDTRIQIFPDLTNI